MEAKLIKLWERLPEYYYIWIPATKTKTKDDCDKFKIVRLWACTCNIYYSIIYYDNNNDTCITKTMK